MRIVFVADVFGPPGREAVESRLPSLREELGAALAVVNGENAADGRASLPAWPTACWLREPTS